MRTKSQRIKREVKFGFVTSLSKRDKLIFGSFMLVVMIVISIFMVWSFIDMYNLFVALEKDIIPYVIDIIIFFSLGIGLFIIVSLFSNTLRG